MSAASVVDLDEMIELAHLFNEDGELRIFEDSDGWAGFRRDDGGNYTFVDNRRPEDDWTREIVVGPRAVREAVEHHVREGPA